MEAVRMTRPEAFDSQITWLYYDDLAGACAFFEEVMGFELVVDQEWAKIYRIGASSFLGGVAGDRGFRKPQRDAPVLVTLVTQDVDGWYNYLKEKGIKILRGVEDREEIQIRCFFFEGPGGYAFEVQEFLAPDAVRLFHGDGEDRNRSS
jgi:predicted enzyme related to lactoylglutathione lyase